MGAAAAGAEPFVLDGSTGPRVMRRLVAWRRLEPGDERRPDTELAPESEHLEVRVFAVAVGRATLDALERIAAARAKVEAPTRSWRARYEPAGTLLAAGGGAVAGTLLDYLPGWLGMLGGGLMLAGAAVGAVTRMNHDLARAAVDAAWQRSPERETLDALVEKLRAGAKTLREQVREEGYRLDVRVGDPDGLERLLGLDPDALGDPESWRADASPTAVRYLAVYRDGRQTVVDAELET